MGGEEKRIMQQVMSTETNTRHDNRDIIQMLSILHRNIVEVCNDVDRACPDHFQRPVQSYICAYYRLENERCSSFRSFRSNGTEFLRVGGGMIA